MNKKEYGDLNKNVAKVKKKSANTSGAAVTDGKENISDVPVGLLCDIAEEISDNGKNDEFYEKIKDRYENFSRDNLLTVTYTDAIVDFNSKLIGSSLQSKYIL